MASEEIRNKDILKGSLIKKESRENEDGGGLLSFDKLRASPDLWPEKIPGITDFIAARTDTPIRTPAPEWSSNLSQEDIQEIKHLSTLSREDLVMEIKKLYDEAYQLGVQESKEMTRGKYLGIFKNTKKKG